LGKSILILGGGFGGLTSANELRARLGSEHTITLVDKKAKFFMGLAKLWILSGRRELGEGSRDLKLLERKGVKVLEEEVRRIDVSAKLVRTDKDELSFDYLIVALGADLASENLPGFRENAFNFYTVEGAYKLREALQELDKGKVVVVVSAIPFKCPSAPYEAAMLMDEMLRQRWVRNNVDIQIYTPEPQPLPVAGETVGDRVKAFLSERNIGFNPNLKPKKIDGKSKVLNFDNGKRINYDLVAGVPVHVVPKVIKESGLAGPSGWIPVNKRTLQTNVPNIYAIGDCASFMTANSFLVPRLGILAEEEAKIVSTNIANEIVRNDTRVQFEGHGTCFIEVGGGRACLAQGDFLAEPAPKIVIDFPSTQALALKKEFEAFRLAAWFWDWYCFYLKRLSWRKKPTRVDFLLEASR
jgi:sulfide:quinone oxidoreductase